MTNLKNEMSPDWIWCGFVQYMSKNSCKDTNRRNCPENSILSLRVSRSFCEVTLLIEQT